MDLTVIGIVAVFVAFTAWREHRHDQHVKSLEAALTGKPLPAPRKLHGPLSRVLKTNEQPKREHPKRVELDVARNSSEAMDHMKKQGIRFTEAGPVVVK